MFRLSAINIFFINKYNDKKFIFENFGQIIHLKLIINKYRLRDKFEPENCFTQNCLTY
jgi:hypothetical protein